MAEVNQETGKKNADGRGRKKARVLKRSPHKLETIFPMLSKLQELAAANRKNYSGVSGSMRDGIYLVTANGVVSLETLPRTPLARSITAPLPYIVEHRDDVLTFLSPVDGVQESAADNGDADALADDILAGLGIEDDDDGPNE